MSVDARCTLGVKEIGVGCRFCERLPPMGKSIQACYLITTWYRDLSLAKMAGSVIVPLLSVEDMLRPPTSQYSCKGLNAAKSYQTH